MLNYAAKSDERGWSIADHFLGIDEGTAAVPLPLAAAARGDRQKAVQAQRKRSKDAYSLLTKHVTDADHNRHMQQNHFQDGFAAFTYLQGACQLQVTNLRLRDLDKEWEAIDMLADIGVNENSVALLAKHIRGKNALRPVAHHKTLDQQSEKLLERRSFSAPRNISRRER